MGAQTSSASEANVGYSFGGPLSLIHSHKLLCKLDPTESLLFGLTCKVVELPPRSKLHLDSHTIIFFARGDCLCTLTAGGDVRSETILGPGSCFGLRKQHMKH